MGDRYMLNFICPHCKYEEPELVWYAPTCGQTTHECEKCGKVTNLERYSGISAESCASTIDGLRSVIRTKRKIGAIKDG